MSSERNWILKNVKQVIVDEGGGAYTLSYVMVVPVLMLLACVIVETTLMMMAKVGTTYSAFSGARTGIVWASASDDWSTAEAKIKKAATQSFVPFAGGMKAKGSPPNEASEYATAYAAFVDKPVSKSYVRKKFSNATNNLKVTTKGPPSSFNSDISVTVEYRFRFNIPGIGKLLGEKDSDGYYFPLRSTATLQNEGPQNARQDMGIGYGKL